jgi:chromosome segregation ATPase
MHTHSADYFRIPAPLEHYEPSVRRYILMMSDAVNQLKVVYAQLHVAEAHITSMTTRDKALVSRTQEAEKMVRQAHIRAEKNDAATQKLEETLKTTETRAQCSEQRAFAAQESLANLDRHLKFLIGQENKWRYNQLEESPDMTSQEAHLQVLQAMLSDSAATEAKSPDTVQVPLKDDTALLEAETRIADLTRQLSESNAATARERANSRSLASISSTSRAEADSALAETKRQLHDANTEASAAHARTLELQTQLCRVNDQLSQSDSQLRHVEERATEMDAQARDGQKALTAAVLHGVRVEAERQAAQLSLDTIRAERESLFIVPDLMDALRIIAQRS